MFAIFLIFLYKKLESLLRMNHQLLLLNEMNNKKKIIDEYIGPYQ
jgi:hypothetical protein